MTHRLLPGSQRVEAALRFGQAMTVAMSRKGVGKGPLSEASGVRASAIGEYRRGRNLPTRATASRIAFALSAPSLLTIVEDARRGTCQVCGATVWQDHGRPTLYCSNPCRVIGGQAGQARKRRGTRVDREALEGVLEGYRAAVDAFCGMCPDNDHGFCGNLECPLLPVSRVQPRSSTHEPERVTRPDPYSAEASANRAAGNRRAWADDQGRRDRLSRSSRDRFAAMSDEERVAWKRSISEGRRKGAAA